ncbi:MAG: hypothetical protein K2I11_09170, partial [Bacteroides sp.]|nr:hypothetical protein [Bacteroides sp.]
ERRGKTEIIVTENIYSQKGGVSIQTHLPFSLFCGRTGLSAAVSDKRPDSFLRILVMFLFL